MYVVFFLLQLEQERISQNLAAQEMMVNQLAAGRALAERMQQQASEVSVALWCRLQVLFSILCTTSTGTVFLHQSYGTMNYIVLTISKCS